MRTRLPLYVQLAVFAVSFVVGCASADPPAASAKVVGPPASAR